MLCVTIISSSINTHSEAPSYGMQEARGTPWTVRSNAMIPAIMLPPHIPLSNTLTRESTVASLRRIATRQGLRRATEWHHKMVTLPAHSLDGQFPVGGQVHSKKLELPRKASLKGRHRTYCIAAAT